MVSPVFRPAWVFLVPVFILFGSASCLHSSESTGSEPAQEESTRDDDYELRIIHTNDTHARILEFNRFGAPCRPEDASAGRCFGGVARRATVLEQIRAESPHVLLLDAGDQFQGTLFYSRFKGTLTATLMNELGYDAMVVGNHEFDDGPEVLAAFVDQVDFPVLGSNVVATSTDPLAGQLADSVVLDVGGRKIGVIGVITEETTDLSSPGEGVSFSSIEETSRRLVARLEQEDVDIIVALSHSGLERDRMIASAVEGLDVIVGGHTNSLLSNSDTSAVGPYPLVVESPRGEPVLIVTAFAWGKLLGDLTLTFDAQGVAKRWQGEPRVLDAQIAENTAITELLSPFTAEVEAFSARPIGAAEVDLIGMEAVCRFGECNFGNLIADALLDHGRARGVQVALQNSGGIRAGVSQGTITVGAILTALPFGNTASVFGLLGRDLRAVFEHGVSRAHDPDADGTGRFLQVAGLRYSFDPTAAVGDRIVSIEIATTPGKGSADTSYEPLDEDREYLVICNGFNRSGGDGFEILRDRAIDPYDQGRVISDIVIDYVRARERVAPGVEGRIRRLSP